MRSELLISNQKLFLLNHVEVYDIYLKVAECLSSGEKIDDCIQNELQKLLNMTVFNGAEIENIVNDRLHRILIEYDTSNTGRIVKSYDI